MKENKKNTKWICLCTLIVLYFVGVVILSVSKGITYIDVIAQCILFFVDGVEKILFTPYTLIVMLIIFVYMKQESVLEFVKKLGEIFESGAGFKFKQDIKAEEPTNISESISKLKNELDDNSNDINKHDVLFYKKLFTKTGAMSTVRFMAYAIDQPDRPLNFNDTELSKWMYGDNIFTKVDANDLRKAIQMTSTILISTGIVRGEIIIEQESMSFNNIILSPEAHIALEQLAREGFQMIPQVIG